MMVLSDKEAVVSEIQYGLRGSRVRISFKGVTVIDTPEGNLKGLASHPHYARFDIITGVREDPGLRINLFVPDVDPQHSGIVVARENSLALAYFSGPGNKVFPLPKFPNSLKIFPLEPGDEILVRTNIDSPLISIDVKSF